MCGVMDCSVAYGRARTQGAILGERRWIGLIGWLLLCYLAGIVGAQFSPDAWYAALAKPGWTPPGAVFSVVWSVLFTLMAIAAWLVWREHRFDRARTALSLFLIQLALNVGWSALFFGARSPALALGDIVLLWAAVLATIVAFWRLNRAASLLLAPYLAWVSFAAALNFEIWRLNR